MLISSGNNKECLLRHHVAATDPEIHVCIRVEHSMSESLILVLPRPVKLDQLLELLSRVTGKCWLLGENLA